MAFTAEEYTDTIICYRMAEENSREAARIYAERFPERDRHPSKNTIMRCVQRARETGSLQPRRNDMCNARQHIRADDEERIVRMFEENPGNSVRRAAHALGYSRYVVHRTLRQNALHPYHFQRVQQLLPRDAEQRIYFCEGTIIIFIR
ncbi:hypothetical protein X777_13813 [Ooceraea biroi]|uniref:DUF4817 domain-containing protein n=1 Tax=Ooceraea biroi TaxID=2015173 RepID=A0A026VX91_OOCBI|nr:hypothetical protein X777_13813 [Ooceraea biroi]